MAEKQRENIKPVPLFDPHYDLRLPISGQRIYIETVFDNKEDDEDCVIYIVNLHPA